MPNPENIVPYQRKKGDPKIGGCKKGSINMSTQLRRLLKAKHTKINKTTGEEETKPLYKWANIALINQILKGNMRAIELLYDRIDGKVATELKGQLDVNIDYEKMSTEELQKIIHDSTKS